MTVAFHPFAGGTVLRVGVFLAVQIVLGHYLFRRTLKNEGMISLYPDDESAGRTFAGLEAKQLVDMIHTLARQLGAGRVSHVFVADKPDPNAFTARLAGLGNVVVLHSNVLE